MESTAFKEARDFVNKIIDLKQPWTDPEFPPSNNSLANSDDKPEQINKF